MRQRKDGGEENVAERSESLRGGKAKRNGRRIGATETAESLQNGARFSRRKRKANFTNEKQYANCKVKTFF